MSVSYLVKGHFANGKTRVAGIHWPGGPLTPEFQQRVQQYDKVFKQEFIDAPKNAIGLPTFEHIEIIVHKDGRECHKVVLAITPRSVERLSKVYGKPLNVSKHPEFTHNSRGVLVDLTKLGIKTPEAFWRSVQRYAADMYKTAFRA